MSDSYRVVIEVPLKRELCTFRRAVVVIKDDGVFCLHAGQQIELPMPQYNQMKLTADYTK